MTIRTKKFSEFNDAGDLEPNEITVGLNAGTNAQFNNPFPLLPPGTTAERPAIVDNIFYRLRFNTTLQSYEYYDPITMTWVQLEDSNDLPNIPAVIYTAYAPLTSAFDLGTLNSGILKQTVAAGVSTPAIAVNGLDYYGPDYSGYYRDPAGIEDTDSNPIVNFNTAGASSVNYMQINNSLTTTNPTLAALGSDVNVGIDFTAKEAGVFNFSTTASSAAFNFNTGTSNQHISQFTFANTAATRTITWQDADGTVAYLADLNNYVLSVTGTANEIDVDNTDSQNPILSLSSTLDAPGTFTIQGTVALDAIIDDDTMATATDSNVPTAESVVAYVAATPGGAGGSNTEIQYNNGGVLDGDSGFTTNGAGSVAIVGNLTVDNLNLNGNTLSSVTATDVILAPANGQALNVNLVGGGGVTYDFTGAGDFVVTMGSGSFQVDNLDINGNTISSTDTAGNIVLTPDTTGNIVLDGLNWPQADGTANQALITNGAAELSFADVPIVTVPTVDQTIARFDGTGGALEDSGITIDDSNVMSGVTQLNVDNLRLDGNTLSSTDTNGDINLTPDGTGITVSTKNISSSKFIPTGTSVTGTGLYLPAANTPALSVNGARRFSVTDAGLVVAGTGGASSSINDLSAYVSGQGLVTVAASGDVNTAGGFNSILTTRTGNGNVPVGGVGGNLYPTNSAAISWTQINSSYDGWFWQWRCGNLANQTSSSMRLIYQDTLGTPITAISVDYLGEVTFSSPLPVGSGGTGITTTPSNGQIPIGNGTNYTAATLTAGPGVSIANGAGSITISGTGSGIGWTEVTGTTQAMAPDNGYVANNAGLVTLTLPVTASFGTVINVVGKGAGGWQINQNAGQNIQVGSSSSTVGAGGSVASTNQYDSIELLCTTADTVWTVLGGPQGNLTIV